MKVEEVISANVLGFLIEEVNLEDPNLSLKSVHGQKSEEFSKHWGSS